jgi:signal transduction histidine kinase
MRADLARRRPRVWGTVRFRITAIAALAVGVVLVITGVALVVTQRRTLTGNLDEALGEVASRYAEDVAAGPVPERLTAVGDDDAIGQVVVDGQVVAATTNATGVPPVADAPARGRVVQTIEGLPNDETDYRVVSVAVRGPDGPATVHVAAPLDDIDESVALLGGSLAVAVPVVTLLLALLVWWLVGRTLRPVEAMRREAAGIGGSALDRRVSVPAGDDEVTRLAHTLNAMLGRIEDSSRRQQRFVADASHELRSPLARMRAELEVDLAHPEVADPTETSRSVLDETIGMQALVDDLLALARSDAGLAPGPVETVDLDEVVARQVRRVRAEGRVAVDARHVGAAQVDGDAARLGRALGNVVDNAVRHARSTVTITLGHNDDTAVLAVTDDGPGIPAERRAEVFERFTRLDGARMSTTGGAGLGLAIAREIVDAHGGTIAVDPDHHPGARLVMRLPLAPGDRER